MKRNKVARPLWRLDRLAAIKALIGALIFGALNWPATVFDLGVPLSGEVELYFRPGLAAPLLVGFTQGPLAGALTGLLGHLLGNLLAGPGTRAGDFVFGPISSAWVGLLAGLGGRSLRRFRTVGELGAMALWICLAGVGASLFTAALAWLLAGLGATVSFDFNLAVSSAVTVIVNGLLLMPALLFAWGSLIREEAPAKQ